MCKAQDGEAGAVTVEQKEGGRNRVGEAGGGVVTVEEKQGAVTMAGGHTCVLRKASGPLGWGRWAVMSRHHP